MRRSGVFSFLALISPLAWGTSLEGQDPDYTLMMSSATASPGADVDLPQRLANLQPCDGLATGLCSDPLVAQPVAAIQGAAVLAVSGGNGPAFFSLVYQGSDGVAFGVVFDLSLTEFLPPGAGQEILLVTYSLVGVSGSVTNVDCCATSGNPPVDVVVLDDQGTRVVPVTVSGVINVLDCNQMPDCNMNGTLDACDISLGASLDCQANGVPDECDIALGLCVDCDSNGVPDECQSFPDCNLNGTGVACDMANGTSLEVSLNGVADECEVPHIRGDLNQDGAASISALARLCGDPSAEFLGSLERPMVRRRPEATPRLCLTGFEPTQKTRRVSS